MSTPGQVNFARAMAYIEKVKVRLGPGSLQSTLAPNCPAVREVKH